MAERNPGAGEGKHSLILTDFKGVNIHSPRQAIDDGQFTWLENFFPISNGNLSTIKQPLAIAFTYSSPSIFSCWDGYLIYSFLSDGSAYKASRYTPNTQIAPPATFTNPKAIAYTDGTSGNTGILIIDPTKGYWDYGITTSSVLHKISGSMNGTSIAAYAGRVWVANGIAISFTDIASYTSFGGAGGKLSINESYIQSITALFSANGYLYIFGSSSIDILSNVQISGGVTSYSRVNVCQSIGTPYPQSICTYSRSVFFANVEGAYLLSGSTPQKISDPISGLWDYPVFTGDGFVAVPATVSNESCILLQMQIIDTFTNLYGSGETRNILAIFCKSKWFFAYPGWDVGQIVSENGGEVVYAWPSPATSAWTLQVAAKVQNWSSVCWGNPGGVGVFVAVAYNIDSTTQHVMTSLDGVVWTIRYTPADTNSWNSVCYGTPGGVGLFVAVGYNVASYNLIMTSPDGITWTLRTSPVDVVWSSVCYGTPGGVGLFVAVGSYGGTQIMTSPDGITWTLRTNAMIEYPTSVAWGTVNGVSQFMAVFDSGTGNRSMSSLDGITWSLVATPADNGWMSICYLPSGTGSFSAVASSGTGNRVMTYSVNGGIAWMIRTSAADNSWNSIAYGNGKFVAVASSGTGNRVMTSPDGITWTIRTSAADNVWRSIAYGNGLFVAVASTGTGNRVMTSPDGITWTIKTSAADNSWISIAYGNGLFVAVAYTGTGNRVMTSVSIVAWKTQLSASDNDWTGIATNGTDLVAVAASGSTTGYYSMKSSDEGLTWVSVATPADSAWSGVCYGGGKYVTVAYNGTGSHTMTWQPMTYQSAIPVSQLFASYGQATLAYAQTKLWDCGTGMQDKELFRFGVETNFIDPIDERLTISMEISGTAGSVPVPMTSDFPQPPGGSNGVPSWITSGVNLSGGKSFGMDITAYQTGVKISAIAVEYRNTRSWF